MQLQKLNFPKYDFRLKKTADEKLLIFDDWRKEWLLVTPEEWVRQHCCKHLVEYYGYPKSLIVVESAVQVYQTQQRSDILVKNKHQNYILVECKRPSVKINQEVLHQALRYNAQYQCPFLYLTNGLQHYFFKLEDGAIHKMEQLPFYKS